MFNQLKLNLSLNLRLFRRKRWSHTQVIFVMVIKGLSLCLKSSSKSRRSGTS